MENQAMPVEHPQHYLKGIQDREFRISAYRWEQRNPRDSIHRLNSVAENMKETIKQTKHHEGNHELADTIPSSVQQAYLNMCILPKNRRQDELSRLLNEPDSSTFLSVDHSPVVCSFLFDVYLASLVWADQMLLEDDLREKIQTNTDWAENVWLFGTLLQKLLEASQGAVNQDSYESSVTTIDDSEMEEQSG